MIIYQRVFGGRRHYRSAVRSLCVCVLAVAWATLSLAQSTTSNAITITSPAPGTTVAPGQSLQVSVSVAAGSNFGSIQVIGEDIGITPPMQSPPFSFTLTIPTQISGPKQLTALGILGPGNGIFSQPVTVNVEVPTPVTSLTVTPPRINFNSAGDQVNLTVTGKFSDGTVLDITKSSLIEYQSNDINVATVTPRGSVTATGGGSTGILVKYGDQLIPVPVSVRTTFAGTPGSTNCDDVSVSALATQYGGIAAAAKALGYSTVQALQNAIAAYCGP